MKLFLPALVVLMSLLAAPAFSQDYDKGKNAYLRGDYETAMREFRPLAEQGHADAQYNLGNRYFRGIGVPPDDVSAHMWFNLAAGQGNEEASRARGLVALSMTPDQITEAQRMAREWLEAHPQ